MSNRHIYDNDHFRRVEHRPADQAARLRQMMEGARLHHVAPQRRPVGLFDILALLFLIALIVGAVVMDHWARLAGQ